MAVEPQAAVQQAEHAPPLRREREVLALEPAKADEIAEGERRVVHPEAPERPRPLHHPTAGDLVAPEEQAAVLDPAGRGDIGPGHGGRAAAGEVRERDAGDATVVGEHMGRVGVQAQEDVRVIDHPRAVGRPEAGGRRPAEMDAPEAGALQDLVPRDPRDLDHREGGRQMGVEIRLPDRPVRAGVMRLRLEIRCVERAAPAAPDRGAAAEVPDAEMGQVMIGIADDLRAVERLGPVLPLEPAPLAEEHPSAPVRERQRKGDAGRARADDAAVERGERADRVDRVE